MPTYKHTQTGWVLIIANGITLLLLFYLLPEAGSPPWVLTALALLFAALLIVFSGLTVEIHEGRLRAYLGPRIRIKDIPLSEIESAHVVRNASLMGLGWGIRWTSHGWLYNVSGTQAVEIILLNGKTFLLGTDEPDALSEALRGAIAAA